MKQVKEKMETAVGVSPDDLEDYAYHDAYADDVPPSTCAKRALVKSGWGKVMSL